MMMSNIEKQNIYIPASLQVPKKKKKKWEKKKVWSEICESFKLCGLILESPSGINTLKSNPYHIQSVESDDSYLIHKFNPLLGDVWKGKASAVDTYNQLLSEYERRNIKLIDPLQNVLHLINRYTLHQALKSSDLFDQQEQMWGSNKRETLRLPRTVKISKYDDVDLRLQMLKQNDIHFPCIFKPLIANGEEKSHKLVIVLHEDGVKSIRGPGVIQQFIPHLPVLYKLFVINRQCFLIHRSSIKNIYRDKEKWGSIKYEFDSRQVSSMSPCAESELIDDMPSKKVRMENEPSLSLVNKIKEKLTQDLGVTLFGVDIIKDLSEDVATYYVIDINYFPGYEGIANFSDHLAEHVSFYVKNQTFLPKPVFNSAAGMEQLISSMCGPGDSQEGFPPPKANSPTPNRHGRDPGQPHGSATVSQ